MIKEVREIYRAADKVSGTCGDGISKADLTTAITTEMTKPSTTP